MSIDFAPKLAFTLLCVCSVPAMAYPLRLIVPRLSVAVVDDSNNHLVQLSGYPTISVGRGQQYTIKASAKKNFPKDAPLPSSLRIDFSVKYDCRGYAGNTPFDVHGSSFVPDSVYGTNDGQSFFHATADINRSEWSSRFVGCPRTYGPADNFQPYNVRITAWVRATTVDNQDTQQVINFGWLQ